ncbi:ferrous iron transport protein B [Methylocystis sp. L43]|jgi:ferrous iron transport protein B|uniref:ferrous iron transport protein B n=1 Tax=unclassified Methylocystis TaxID=2625913 RepID=UPI0018C25841|nr:MULTISPECIES: ferrous iron transport protein B [unclassified Methylocystis]MBG0799852.1 ferrous iron transport protein B [Methylocystis sp. L43]MBG0807635.1 ferrous iron transport protein B [Methylocystis sp. H15]
MTIKFGDLKVGERGRVTGFERGDTAHRQKLLSMGLTPGVEFTVMRVAPLGDPVEVRVRDTSITLRRDEASALSIELIAGEAKIDRKDSITIAIVGNPNCGKTTLFNGLTGTHQRVGNWGGVTVEKKEGEFEFADQRFRVVDMPGIHSLDTYDEATSVDERIARDYVLSGEADLIINIIDASHLEHSLYLTTQLLEMSAPVAVVLNIMDDVDGREAQLDVDAVQRRLGCPVAAIVASRRKQIESLKADVQQWVPERKFSSLSIDYPPLIEQAISELSLMIRKTSTTSRLDDRWLALRLLEGDGFATRLVTPAVNQAYVRLASGILHEMGDEADTVIANSRYRFAHMIAEEALPKRAVTGSSASDRIDRVVLNRFLGIPIFVGVMYCLFWFTIELSRAFRPFFWLLSETLFIDGPRYLLGTINTPAWLNALIADGLGNGLLQVVTFIPIIGFLYLFVSALEESGYMARANFVMDRVMKSLGLPGNAFIPMVVGFGCNVPAIMATRTMERPRDRIVAVLMSPFMSCGGRLAVYTVFAAAFFPEHGQFVIFGFYLLGIVFAMLTSLLMKFSLLPEERSLHVETLPSYHWPKLRNVLINAWIRLKMFIFRVGKFIIPLVFLVKILGAWGTDGSFNQKPVDQSMLAAGGRAITPVLTPMGVQQDNWPATVALITGALHKVVIVTTLSSIYMEQAQQMAPAAAEPPKEPPVPTEAQHNGPAASLSPSETKPIEGPPSSAVSSPSHEIQQSGGGAGSEDGKTVSADRSGQTLGGHVQRSDRADASPAEAAAPDVTEQAGQKPAREIETSASGGVTQEDAKAKITALWRSTATAQAFAAAITEAGWNLARGERRDLVLIDPKGGAHPISRSIEGVSAKVIRKRMARLDPMSLPNVSEAQAHVRAAVAAEQARTASQRVPPAAADRAPGAVQPEVQKPTTMEQKPPPATEQAPPMVSEHAGQAPQRDDQLGGRPKPGLQHAPPKEEQGFDLLGRLNRAALTVPQNLKAMVGMGKPVRLHKAAAGLAPALATKFDGQVGALAYLILILCYPCIATTAATVRETNQRWTAFMVLWTISIGYGAAVLFYQIGTFALHPYSSAAWILGVVTYFVVLGAVSLYVGARPTTVAASDLGAKA